MSDVEWDGIPNCRSIIVMYCNSSQPDVALVVLSCKYDAHNAPSYQISTQSNNPRLSYCRGPQWAIRCRSWEDRCKLIPYLENHTRCPNVF